MPKSKKVNSYMSQYLNKSRSQKPTANYGPAAKLPAMFGRVISSKK